MERHLAPVSPPEQDGRRDFHFLFGRWRITNRKLADPFDENGTDWLEFESSSVVRPILGGLGNTDAYSAPEFPGRGSFEGLALRLFDPRTKLWRIWWVSTAQPGSLDAPLVGRFIHGKGRFECDDIVGGRPVRVRYGWKDITPLSACWEQSFSFDDGATFRVNWIQELVRDA